MPALLMIITIYICILLVCNSTKRKGIVLTPQFLFTASFLPGLIYLIFYIDKWNVQFSTMTIITLVVGVSNFVIVSICFQVFFPKKYRYISNGAKDKQNEFSLNGAFLNFMIVLTIVVILWTLHFIITKFGTNITRGIYLYRVAYNTGSDEGYFGFVLSNLRSFIKNASFVWGALVVHSLIYKKKENRIKLFILLGLGMVSDLLSGARGDVIYMIIAMGIDFYIIYEDKYEWKKHIPKKILFRMLIIVIVLVLSYQFVGNLIGRDNDEKNSDFIAKYISAEYVNFDTYIKGGETSSSPKDWLTLRKLMEQTYHYLGMNSNMNERYIFIAQAGGGGFQRINGYNLGNVYTAYFNYYHDGGIIGVILFTGIMAIILQFMFWNTVNNMRKKTINIHMIIYSLAISACMFSFFAERFYDYIIDYQVLKRILFYWIVLTFAIKYKNVKRRKLVMRTPVVRRHLN